MSRRFLVGALALGLLLPLGCGPVEYVAQVGGRASSALAQARREKADILAPYEYTAAGEYLKKSKEEASRSQFETALKYGKQAEELAGRARALSRERKAGRNWSPTETPPSETPPGLREEAPGEASPTEETPLPKQGRRLGGGARS